MTVFSNEEINLLRRNARSVVRELGLLNDAYFDIGVTLAERHLLIELSSSLYPTIGEIAERLLLDKSTASRLIGNAVKKGYINYSSDERDKRRRFLQLTERGKEVLNAFEPIAFNQTKEALLTLNAEEIELIYRGIALYAKGLKSSRLQKKIEMMPMMPQDKAGLAHLLADLYEKERPFQSVEHRKSADWTNLFEAYHCKGSSYFIMKMESEIIGGIGISPYPSSKTPSCELRHLCLQSEMRHLAFEKVLIGFCLKEAKKLGYDHCYVDLTREILFSSIYFQEQGFQFIEQDTQKKIWRCQAC